MSHCRGKRKLVIAIIALIILVLYLLIWNNEGGILYRRCLECEHKAKRKSELSEEMYTRASSNLETTTVAWSTVVENVMVTPIEKPDIAKIHLNTTDSMEKDQNITKDEICKTRPMFEDWRFKCYEKCPDAIQSLRVKSINVFGICSSLETDNITAAHISEDRYIFSVPYNSTCLQRLVLTYCYSSYRVPNIAHYVWFSSHVMEFIHFLSFMSVMKVQKPCLIFLHADSLPFGNFWNNTLHFINNIIHVYVDPPQEIHGNVLGCIEHKSDVHRLRCMRDYGGIYFDVDQILLKSLDPLRNYSFTQSVEVFGLNLANSLLISVSNAEFVNIWLDHYKTYNSTQWAHHSTIVPFLLSQLYPNLIHIESNAFVRPNFSQLDLIYKSNYNWVKNYALHIYLRSYDKKHDLNDIRNLNTTIGSMSRYILYDSKELCYVSM